MANFECMVTTLLKTNTWLFGPGSDLPELELPTVEFILRCYAAGCRMCEVFEYELGWRSRDNPAKPVRLRRSSLEPNRLDVSIGAASFYFEHIPTEWREIEQARRDEPTPTPNIILAEKWLKDCLSGHSDCIQHSGYMPTRLLDLKAFEGSSDLTLVQTGHVSHQKTVEYFTLSHCWGGDVPMKTTSGNFRSYQERIKFDKLPLSFRDAIDVTRDLGYRYLWIDSFCIIQNDEEDWRKEAARMSDVYGGSICTLCADSAENSTQGCRVGARQDAEKRGGKFQVPYRRHSDLDSETGDFRVFSRRPQSWASELGEFHLSHPDDRNRPLTHRAWAYQERELSLRMLHFSANLLLWECSSFKATSETPWRQNSLTYGKILDLGGSAETRDEWYRMVERYSSRDLTEESDKLPALSGLASRFHRRLPLSTYLAGIWSEHLPSALLWRTYPKAMVGYRSGPHRPEVTRAPTWSWASLDGAVSYQSQRSRIEISGNTTINPLVEPDEWHIRILSTACIPSAVDNYGAVRGGYIVTEASLVKLRITPRRPDGQGLVRRMLRLSREEWNFVSLLIDDEEEVVGLFFQDVHTGGIPRSFQPLYCLGIRSEIQNSASPPPSPSLPPRPDPAAFRIIDELRPSRPETTNWPARGLCEPSYMGLGLIKAETGNQFKRIGLVRWLKQSVFEGIESSVITII